MTTRKMVPRGDDEGGIGTALKRWASAFINALTANSVTVSDLTASLPIFTDEAKKLTTVVLPKFAAHKNGVTQEGFPTSTWTKVTFATEDYDVGGTYDAPNSKWVPGIVGKAQINASLRPISGVDQTKLFISIYINGVSFSAFSVTFSGNLETPVTYTRDIPIAAITDYVEIYCYQTTGGNIDLNGDSIYTRFEGHMLP